MPSKFQVKSKWSIGHIVFGLIAFIAVIGGAVAFSSRQLAMNTDNRSQASGCGLSYIATSGTFKGRRVCDSPCSYYSCHEAGHDDKKAGCYTTGSDKNVVCGGGSTTGTNCNDICNTLPGGANTRACLNGYSCQDVGEGPNWGRCKREGCPSHTVTPPVQQPPAAVPPVQVTYERCKLHQTWWRFDGNAHNGHYQTINYDAAGNLVYSTLSNKGSFSSIEFPGVVGEGRLEATADTVVKMPDGSQKLVQYLLKFTKIYRREVPIDPQTLEVKFAAAPAFTEVTSSFAAAGPHSAQAFSAVSGVTDQAHLKLWKSNKGWRGQVSGAGSWIGQLTQYAASPVELPGGTAGTLQAFDEYTNPQKTKVTQVVYQSNKGYVREVALNNGIPQDSGTSGWSMVVDLNTNPSAIAGTGQIVAVSNYVVCP